MRKRDLTRTSDKVTARKHGPARMLALILAGVLTVTSVDISAFDVQAAQPEEEILTETQTGSDSPHSDKSSVKAAEAETGDTVTESTGSSAQTTVSAVGNAETDAGVSEPDAESVITESVEHTLVLQDREFAESVTVDGVTVTVNADKGVFPEGSRLKVRRIKGRHADMARIDGALDEVRDPKVNVGASYTFDISIVDKKGMELEPDRTKGEVYVGFYSAEMENENLTPEVYHIIDENSPSYEDAVDEAITAGRGIKQDGADNTAPISGDINLVDGMVVRHLASESADLSEQTDSGEKSGSSSDEQAAGEGTSGIIAKTDGFSYYTVEFTYGELTYVLDGDCEAKLSDVLDTIGITGNIESASVSDDSLFTASEVTVQMNEPDEEIQDENDESLLTGKGEKIWVVRAQRAFTTEEEMTVTVDGIDYLIKVTDNSSLPGARHHKDSSGNVFLGGNYIEVGLDKTGSYGTSAAAPSGYHATSSNGGKLGLRSDGDGFNVGEPPKTGDFFLPGSPEECYILGYALNGSRVDNRNAARNSSFWSSPKQAPTTEDQSSGDKLKAVTTGITKDNVKIVITTSFGVNDKFFKTEVEVTNLNDATIQDVRYARSFDPDQDVEYQHTYVTYNKVISNPNSSTPMNSDTSAMVVARGSKSLDGYFFIAFDQRARASRGVAFSLRSVFMDGLWTDSTSMPTKAENSAMACSSSNTNGYKSEDNAIALTFKLGTLKKNESAKFEYYSSLDPNVESSFKEVKKDYFDYDSDGNGEAEEGTKTERIDDAAIYAPAKPYKKGFLFLEWNTSADGTGSSYQPGARVKEKGSVTLYAIYEPVKNTANVNLTLDGNPWTGQKLELYQDNTKKYDLKASGSNGKYSNSAVINGTYDVYMNGRDAKAQISFDADQVSLTKTVTISYATLTVKTYLDDSLSIAPGEVTLRTGSKVIYVPSVAGGVNTQTVLTSEPAYNIYVDGEDTGFDASPSDKTKDVYFYTMTANIKDDTAWRDAAVELTDANGNLKAVLAPGNVSGTTVAYTKIMQKDDAVLKVVVNGIDTHRTLTPKTGASVTDLAYYSSQIKLTGTGITGFNISINNGTENYSYSKTAGSTNSLTYRVEHIYINDVSGTERPYDLDLEGIFTGDAGYKVTESNKNLNIELVLVNFYRCQITGTGDARTLSYLTDPSYRVYVVKGKNMTAYRGNYGLNGYTFACWSTSKWTLDGAPNTAFNFSSAINADTNLYTNYAKPTLLINDIVRTNANGAQSGTGLYYTMSNLTITGFEKGDDAIKYIFLKPENAKSVKITNNSNKTITSGGTKSTSGTTTTITPLSTGESIGITFNSTVSMTAAQEFLRKNVIIELTSGTAHNITVEAMDGNGEFVAANSVSGSASSTNVKFIDGTQNLNGGTYYVLSNATYNGYNGHRDGLTVANNTTTYLYIASGVTLTATGYAAQGQTGAGPGIYVPENSTLVIYGQGTVKATGGNAAVGAKGDNGGNAEYYFPNSSSGEYIDSGYGGKGGYGGGGAAAGIGGAGGNGGDGGNGGARTRLTQAAKHANDGGSSWNDGAKGGEGKSGYKCGTVYIQGSVTVNATGGSAASVNTGTATGGESKATDKHKLNGGDDKYYSIGGGGGGGTGGSGGAASNIGGGGAGGGGGNGGGSGGIDYNESNKASGQQQMSGGEGGNGGQCGNKSSTWAGKGKDAQSGHDSGRDNENQNNQGTSWKYGGGRSASLYSAGAASGSKGGDGTIYNKSTTKNLDPATYSITYKNAGTGHVKGTVTIGTGTTKYTPGQSNTITLPSYEDSNSSVSFLGWQLSKYAKGKNDNISCGKADSDAKKRFQAGQQITLDATTYGEIEFTAVTEIMGGIKDDDTKRSITLNASSSTTYYKYTVKVTVDGTQTDRGAISIGGLTVTADTSKNYTVTTTSGGSKNIVIDGAQVGSVSAGGTTTIAYKTIKVNVAGKLPSSVRLAGTGAPQLVDEGKESSPYVYSYETLASNATGGPFNVYVDGEDTGIKAAYSTPATVQYYTLTVNVNTAGVAGSAVNSVELRNEDETVFLGKNSTAESKAVFTTTQLKSDTPYTIYVNGEETDKTAKFASDSTVEVSYARYTTYVNTMLDDSTFDFGTVMFGENRMVRKEKGKYQVTLRTTGSYDLYVDGAKVLSEVSVGSTQTVDFYTVNYEYSGDALTRESGDLPEDENYYLKGSNATLLEKGAIENGGKTFTGWKVGTNTYDPGRQIQVNSTVTAMAQWRRTALTEADQKFELSLDETMFTYNGKSQVPGITVTRNGVKLGVDKDYTVTFSNTNTCMDRGGSNTINAGTIGVTVTGIGDYEGTLYDSYMIMKKTVAVEGLDAVDRVYNGSIEVDLTVGDVVITGIEPVDEGRITVETGAKGRMETAVVGTDKPVYVNETQASGDASPNYVLEAADPITVNISVKPITADMFSASSVVYNGAAQEPVLVTTDIQPVDEVNINLFDEVTFCKVKNEAESNSTTYAKSNTYWYSDNVNTGKGKITIKAVYNSEDQYSNYEGRVQIEFDIARRPLVLTATRAESLYGEGVVDVSRYYTITSSEGSGVPLDGASAPAADAQEINPEQISPVCTATDWASLNIHAVTTVGDGYDAGTYADAVKVMYTPNANYEVTGSTADYVIGKASADRFKVTDKGYTGVYDGEDHGITVKTEGINESDRFTVYYSDSVELNADNYNTSGRTTGPTYKNVCDHTVYYWVTSANYEGKGGSAQVSITPAPLAVKPVYTVTYGDEGVNNINETITYSGGSTSITMKPGSEFLSYAGLSTGGFVGSDTASSALSGEVKAAASYAQYGNAGEYTLTVDTENTTLAANNNNYVITYLPGVFTVNKKQVSFVWEPVEASFTYTETEHGVFASVDPADIEGSDDVRVGEYVIGESSTNEKWISNRGTASGNYIARVKALAGNKARNYSFVPDESAITTDENGVTGNLTTNASNSAIKWTIQKRAGDAHNPAEDYGDGENQKAQVTLYADWAADSLPYNGEVQYMTARLYYYPIDAGTGNEVAHTENNRVYLGTRAANDSSMTMVYPVYGGVSSKKDINTVDGENNPVPYTATITGVYGAEPYKYKLDQGTPAVLDNENPKPEVPSTMSHNWTITSGSNAWTVTPSITDWYYGDTASAPAGKATYGTVSFLYRTVTKTGGETPETTYGVWTETVPTTVGSYQMKATVDAAADGSYSALTLDEGSYCNFEIKPAELIVTAVDKTGGYGESLVQLTYTAAVIRGAVTEQEKTALNIDLEIDTSAAAVTNPVPVGTYPIVQKTEGYVPNDNISLTVVPGTYTVTNALITASAENVSCEYDGERHYISVTVKDRSGNVISVDDYETLGVQIYYSSTEELNKNNYATGYTTCPYCQDADAYTIYYYVTMPNHTPVAGSATVNISKKALTATLPDASMTYGEDPAALMSALAVQHPASSLTYSGFVTDDSAAIFADSTITYSTEYVLNENKGIYAINASGLAPNNYTVAYTPGHLTVSPKPLSEDMFALTIPDGGYTYNGTGKEPTVTGSDRLGLIELLGSSDYTVTYSDNMNASDEAKAVINAAEGGNYSGSVTKTFSISPTPVTITAKDVTSGYNQTKDISNEYEVTSGAILEADKGDLQIKAVTTVTKSTPIGEYEGAVTVKFNKNNHNYAITTVAGKHTVTTKEFSAVYSEGVDTVYDGADHSGEVTVKTGKLLTYATVYYKTGSGFTNKDYSGEGSTEVPSFKNAGVYTVYYAAVCDSYTTQTGSYTVNIRKAPVRITIPDASITYGDDPASALGALSADIGTLSATEGAVTGLVDGESASDVLTGTLTCSSTYAQYQSAGRYAITGSGLSADNYEISYLPGILTVNRSPVTFNWNYNSETPFDYDGTEKRVDATVTGTLNGDTVTAVCTEDKATDAGTYTATVTSLKGTGSANYAIGEEEPTATCEWTVAKAANEWTVTPVLIYAEGAGESITYNYIAAAKYGTVVHGTISYDADAKTYTLPLSVEEGSNYSGLSESVIYTVPETPPTTAPTLGPGETITLTYGQSLGSIEGGKYTAGEYITDYTAGSPVGTYSIVKKTATTGTVYLPGTITVNKKDISLGWSGTSFVYDGEEHEVVASVNPSDIINGDSIYVTAYENDAEVRKLNKATGVGSYIATVSTITGTNVGNYNINESSRSHTWEISKAPATQDSDPTKPDTEHPGANYFTTGLAMAGWTYGDTPSEPSATAQYGTVTYTYYTDEECTSQTTVDGNGASVAGGRPKNAGTYWVQASVEGTQNYDGISMKSSFTVAQRPIAIIASDITGQYKAAIAELTYKMTGTLAQSETLEGIGITITTTADNTSPLGEYPITVNEDTTKSGNYSVTKVNGTYFITGMTGGMMVTATGYSAFYDGAEHGISVTVTKDDASAPAPVIYYSDTKELTAANYATGSEESPVLKDVGSKRVYYYVASEVYEDVAGSCDINITQKAVTVTANSHTITYGDVPSHNGFTYTGFVDGENAKNLNLTQNYTIDYNRYDPAGGYTIQPNGLPTDTNYSFSYVGGTLTVNPKPVTFRWDSYSFTYNGTGQGPVVTHVKGLVNNDEITVGSYANDQTFTPVAVNVGSYKTKVAELAGDKAASYTFTDAEATRDWSISEGRNYFTVTPDIDDWCYGDEHSVPAGAAAYGEVSFTFSTSRDGAYSQTYPTVPGTYYMKASVPAGMVNNTMNYPALGTDPIVFDIKKASVSIKADDKTVIRASASVDPSTDPAPGSGSGTDPSTDPNPGSGTDPSSDPGSGSGTDPDQGQGTSGGAQAAHEWPLLTYTITGNDAAKAYFADKISLECVATDTVFADATAGVYPITLTVSSGEYDSYYTVTTSSGNLSLFDDSLGVEVNAEGYDGYYDGEEHGITVSLTGDNAADYSVYYSESKLASTENVAEQTGVGTVSPILKTAGTTDVWYYVINKDSKACITMGSRSIIIRKRPLIITANDNTINNRQEPADNGVTYSGLEDDVLLEHSGFVPGEDTDNLNGTLSYSYNYRKGDVPGEYRITPMGLKAVNYDPDFRNGKLNVIAVAETVTVEGVTAQNAVYDGKPHTGYTGTAKADDGRISESELEFIYKDASDNIFSTPPVNAGTYTLIIKIPDSNIYYTGSTSLTFTIDPADIRVYARDAQILQGNEAQNNGVVYTGFIGEDTKSTVIQGTLDFEYMDGSGNAYSSSTSPAGDYRIIPCGITSKNSNYTISVVEGKLEVVATVPEPVLSVTTVHPTGISTVGATLNGLAEPLDKLKTGADAKAGFKYRKLTEDDADLITVAATPDSTGMMEYALTGLEAGTAYICYAYAKDVTDTIREGKKIGFVTTAETPEGTGEIDVGVTSEYEDLTDVYITIEHGNTVVASQKGQTSITVPFNAIPFTGLKDGQYNVVVRTLNGEFTETRMVSIKDGSTENLVFNIPQTSGMLSSTVEIKTPDTPEVAVEGLQDIADEDEKLEVALGHKDVDITLEVEKKDEEQIENGTAINTAAKNANANINIDTFLEINVIKTVNTLDGAGNVTNTTTGYITDTVKGEIVDSNGDVIEAGSDDSGPGVVLEIAVPYDTSRSGIVVWRSHDNSISPLGKLTSRPSDNYMDGRYYIGKGYVFIYGSLFSTYAIGYEEDVTPSGGGGTGGGGGGSTPTPADAPVVKPAENGTVTVSPEDPKPGDPVTVNPKPDKGYETGDVKVTDKDGNEIPVTKNDDGTYSYPQPESGPVTIEVTFKPVGPVIVEPEENGTVKISPIDPKPGDPVTISTEPADGFETGDVTVTDKDGNPVEVKQNEDGTFTYTQPESGPVLVDVTFRPIPPVITQPENGSVTILPEKPKVGDTVVIEVTPDEGYETADVKVLDKDGNEVPVTKNEDGTYSFVQPATGGVTISVTMKPAGKVAVVFSLNGRPGVPPETQIIDKGERAVCPTPDPTAEGFSFTGWYTDKECTKSYDFETPVEEDITLYAGWKKSEGSEEDEDFGIYFAKLYDDPYEGVYYNEEKDRYEIVYTGDPIRPLILATSRVDGVLREGVDYKVSYSNCKNVSVKKPAKITVKGKGQYKSKKVLELYILPVDLETALDKGLLSLEEEIRVMSGKKLNPVITYRGRKLKASDRTLSVTGKVSADTEVTITGKGKRFTGTLENIPVKVITKEDIKKGAIKAALKAGTHVYNGEAHELTITGEESGNEIPGELTVTAGRSKTPLTEGTDFTVSYSANVNAGTAKAVITGIGEYNGTVVKTFKIAPAKAASIRAELTDPDEPVVYAPKGAMPDISVTAAVIAEDGSNTGDTTDLVKGIDYRLTYSANKKIGIGKYSVTFMGNYKGHPALKGTYKIEQAPMDEAKVESAQKLYKKPGKYLSKPFVSVDGVALKKSDYTVKYYEGEVTDVSADGVKELTSRDKITLEADETSRTVTVAVTGTAKGNYTGTALGYYEVTKPVADKINLSKAKIVAKDKNAKGKDVKVGRQEYTGEVIEPEIRVLVKKDKKTWIEVDPDTYEVSYINNVLKGKATILITGNGEETIGSKTAKFRITNMRFELFKVIFGI